MVSIVALCIIALSSMAILGVTIKQFQAERQQWQMERKDLLDRIQAPTFAQYTHKVIAEKKAEQPKEEEPDVEFVS